MDSGAFTEVVRHGGYRYDEAEYAYQVNRWASNGNLLAAVSQDFMCEPFVLEKAGKTVGEHQRMTIDRYDKLLPMINREAGLFSPYLMPVLQGYSVSSYLEHIRMYGDRLTIGAWVGVGSVCKRNGNVHVIEEILGAIKSERSDLCLHGFGLKTTALKSSLVRHLLHTADSMAWSFAARREGRGKDANDWREARKFVDRIEAICSDDEKISMLGESESTTV
jgi:hypothetical protein